MHDRRLQALRTVAKLGRFTQAAKVRHLTQPAVTFQVRHPEQRCRVRPLDRGRGRVRLPAVDRVRGFLLESCAARAEAADD